MVRKANKQYIMTKNILDFDEFIEEISLNEGHLITYPADTVVRYIQKKYNLDDESVDILMGDKGESIIVDKEISQDILDKINLDLVNLAGYFCVLDNDGVLFYDKKFDKEVFNELKQSGKIESFYHITPSKNDKKIQLCGLVPKYKNKKYTYPERIYLLSDENLRDNEYFFTDFSKHLHSVSNKDCYVFSVYKIDFSKLNNIKLYVAVNAKDYIGYYTMDNIRPEWIEKIDEIHLK